jgi:TPR repeat protein
MDDLTGALWIVVNERDGHGVPKNYVAAAKRHRLAADQGNAHTQGNLGAMGGNEVAAKNRDTIIPLRMTPADISETQRLSREWKPK